jgi:hypothetical protein
MPISRVERIARNESAFRDLNENLEASVHRGRGDADFAGFVCECGHEDCEQTVRMRLADFEHVRSDSQLFFVVPGHEIDEAESVVEQHEGYSVVRKCEEVADLVDDTDRRT